MQPPAPPDLNLTWPSPPPVTPLTGSEVHVWAVELDAGPAILNALRPLLSTSELRRASRFHFEKHRQRFVVGRAVLRLLLGRYLQSPPGGLEFEYGPHGKPALAGALAGTDLQFNLAHSENLALLAFTRGGEIGVDVEQVRPMPDADQLVARFFSPREQLAFKQLPNAEKPAAFFNLWTRKEAWLKATGEGIGHLLGQVEVSFLPGEPERLLSLPQPWGPEWLLYHLSPAPGFTGALALTIPATSLHCWRWNEHVPGGK